MRVFGLVLTTTPVECSSPLRFSISLILISGRSAQRAERHSRQRGRRVPDLSAKRNHAIERRPNVQRKRPLGKPRGRRATRDQQQPANHADGLAAFSTTEVTRAPIGAKVSVATLALNSPSRVELATSLSKCDLVKPALSSMKSFSVRAAKIALAPAAALSN